MTVVVLGGGEFGDAFAAALAQPGQAVVRSPHDRPTAAGLAPLVADLKADIADIMAVIIFVGSDLSGQPSRTLADLDDQQWAAAFEQPFSEAHLRLQAARELLGPGGRVIFVATTGGMAGVAGQVAACAVEEGIRALAKSVALAWQAGGRTVFFAAFDPSALQTADGRNDALLPMVRLLLAAPPALTGASIIADGGILLAP